MDIISFFQQALIIVLIIFTIVLLMSFIYSKFIKKEKEEDETVKFSTPLNKSDKLKSSVKRKSTSYSASSNSEKLFVNTEENRKHVVRNKIVSKPQRFKILNKTGEEE